MSHPLFVLSSLQCGTKLYSALIRCQQDFINYKPTVCLMEFVHIELYNPKGSRNIDTKKKSQQEWCNIISVFLITSLKSIFNYIHAWFN